MTRRGATGTPRRARKPDTATAMRRLIAQVRARIPFDRPREQLCAEGCQGCTLKLLDYLAGELEGWETRLGRGEVPNFGDLHQLVDSSRKVYRTLRRNGLMRDL
ncbi:MAG: hypothetical protein AB2813_06320 [Candidatus Sedimenticola endophacoides]